MFHRWHSENGASMAILCMVTLYYQSSYFQGSCEDIEYDIEGIDDSKMWSMFLQIYAIPSIMCYWKLNTDNFGILFTSVIKRSEKF